MSLIAADHLVRQELKKAATAADVGRGIIGAVKGTGRVIQKGFTEAGRQATKELGGGVGAKMVGGAIGAAPVAAGVGAAAYGVNEAAGDPLGRYVQQKRQQLANRIQGSQVYQQGGVYY